MAVLIQRQRKNNPTSFTVGDTPAIPKGTLCMLEDPRTASGSGQVSGSMIAGVMARDHISGQGVTEAPLFTDGIFSAKCSGSIALGQWVQAGGTQDTITEAALSGSSTGFVNASGSSIIGRALQLGSDDETIQFQLTLG